MIEIYNDKMERVSNPDLSAGYLKQGTRIEHHEAIKGVDEIWHYETVKEYTNGGKDIRKVVDIPGVKPVPAYDEEISILIYTPYTDKELADIEAKKNIPTTEQRLSELEEALNMILSGATE